MLIAVLFPPFSSIEHNLQVNNNKRASTAIATREFRIERCHIAALTWDAMFRSRRAAILAGGGRGSYTSDTVDHQKWAVLCRF